MISPSPPVFYDKTGKRLRRVLLTITGLACILGGALYWFIPATMASVKTAGSDQNFARETLSPVGDLPPGSTDTRHRKVVRIGEGVLTRMVSVVRENGAVKLFNAATKQYVRDAVDWEVKEIGTAAFAVDHYSTVPDHTLMLTFDDGPSAEWTPKILDVLAREHVPATFFVMGERVIDHPDILKRIIADGHMVGNHSMSHPDLDVESDLGRQTELVTTDHVLRGMANYDTSLFRIPTGEPDIHVLAQLQSQYLGYTQVDLDLDTNDWRYAAENKPVPVPDLDGSGHLLVMHDAGGPRAGTVKLVEDIIREAKAKGYQFTTVAPLLHPDQYPHKDIQPTLLDRSVLNFEQAKRVTPAMILPWVIKISLGSVLVLTCLYLTLSVLNDWRQRRRKWPELPDGEMPFVTVALAAYNEEMVVTRTLDALRASNYPAGRFEVIAVNDGSTDGTLLVLNDYAELWPSLRVIDQPNAGKSWALNNAVDHADPRSTVVITLDADTLFERDVILRLARHFIQENRCDNRVGVVAGHVKVGNRRNILTWWQSLEYLNGICIARMAEMMVGAVTVVPGACSAWRRDLLLQIGGFTHDTLAEDADAAMALQRLRYKVLHDNQAICYTEAPETVRPLLKQRKRWMFGNFQVMWKNRRMLFNPRYGVLGMVTMPYAWFTVFLNLLFLPFLLVVSATSLVHGLWQPLTIGTLVFLITSAITPITAILLARENPWHLLVLIVHRPIYEVMRFYLLYTCAYRVIKGAEFSWDKLERLNSVMMKGEVFEDPDMAVHPVAAVG